MTEDVCSAPFESEEIEKLCELAVYQRTYWSLAIGIMAISSTAMCWLFYQVRQRKVLRRPPVSYFSVLILSDLVFVGAFFPYHVANFIKLRRDQVVDVSADPLACTFSIFFVCLALQLNFLGITLITYVPYRMARQAMVMKVQGEPKTDRKLVGGFILLGVAISGVWAGVGEYTGTVGSYNGLYCASKTYANYNGAVIFICVSLNILASMYFTYKTYLVIRSFAQNSSGGANAHIIKASELILKAGLRAVVALLFTWGPIAVACAMSMLGYNPSLEFDIFCGACSKLKTVLDVFVIMQMPQVQGDKKPKKVLSEEIAKTADFGILEESKN